MICFGDEDLERYHRDALDPEAREGLGAHLESCATCRARSEEIAENEQLFPHVQQEIRQRTDYGMEQPLAIGPFRIERELGRGGMGVVYLAEQARPQRRIALKVLRRSLQTEGARRRFRREAEILGRLEHSGIAQVYEAGISDGGEPYFTMEYVRGTRLDEYVREHALGLRERLLLLVKIAEAVHHAHVHGVVHRDLKPSNVLVRDADDGSAGTETDRVALVKILDFGVARLQEADAAQTSETETGLIVGTLPYMSPEQASGNTRSVDARSDVYSIGALGFQLLTGELPFDLSGRSVLEVARVLREESSRRLSDIDRRFRGDLETIFAKALAPEATRRYQSASELAADIRRFLANEPIVARPTSTAYQLRKLIARHRTAFALGAALMSALLVFAITAGALLVRARQAERIAVVARMEATREADTAKRTAAFLERVFTGADPAESSGREPTAGEILDRGAAELREQLAAEPEILASLLQSLGRVYQRLGRYEEAKALGEEAVGLQRTLAEDPRDLASALIDLGHAETRLGEYAPATDAMRESVRLLERSGYANSAEHGSALVGLASALSFGAELPEAAARAREGLRVHRALAEEDEALALALRTTASILQSMGKPDSADALMEEEIALTKRLRPGDHPELARSLGARADNLITWGRHAEAEPVAREALAMFRRLHVEEHDDVAWAAYHLARALLGQGKLEESEALYREAITTRERVLGSDHPQLPAMQSGLGSLLEKRGRTEEALHLYRRALAASERSYGRGHVRTAGFLNNIGLALVETGRPIDGEAHLARALESVRTALGDAHPNTARVLNNLARAKTAQGDHAAAQELYEQARTILAGAFGEDDPETARCYHYRANDLHIQGRWSDAEVEARHAWDIRREHLGLEHDLTVESGGLLGAILVALERYDEAESLLVPAARFWNEFQDGSDRRKLDAERQLNLLRRARARHLAAVTAPSGSVAPTR